MKKTVLAIILALSGAAMALTDKEAEELVKRQARSVHLRYCTPKFFTGAQATAWVTESQTNSYFSILCWQQGYCGLQDVDGERVFIFSVWDPTSPEDFKIKADDMEEELRAKVLYSNPLVTVDRFGGEGSGAKTMVGMKWTEGMGVTAKVEMAPDGEDRVSYTCSVQMVGDTEWVKLATISTIRDKNVPGMGFLASFVEDFARNYKSAKQVRSANFGDVSVKMDYDGYWVGLNTAIFTADETPSEHIDAGPVKKGVFFLKTGGDTENTTTKLWNRIG